MPERQFVYLIDTSCLAHVDARPDANLVWDTLIRLIELGRLRTVEQVMDEVKNVCPPAYNRLNPYRRTIIDYISPELLVEAGRVSQTYRRMSRWRHPNDSADPWLVAAAKLRGYVVVTDEVARRQRIPVVCDRERIAWCNLSQLVEAEMPEVA